MHETTLTITGWLGGEVSLSTAGEHAVASFRVGSTPRRFRDGRWVQGETTWYRVKAWRRLAEHVAASLRKGDPVVVHGRLTAHLWQREDGVAVTQYEVVATSVGHDLGFGTTEFVRASTEGRAVTVAAGETRAEVAEGETAATPSAASAPRAA